MRSTKQRALIALKSVVSLALIAWLVRRLLSEGSGALLASLARLDARFVALAIAAHLAAVTCGVLRWRALLRARGIEQPLAVLARSFLIGRFVGAFTPSTTGLDGWRAVEIGRRIGDLPASASVIAIEKLLGLLAMSSVCVALVPFGAGQWLGASALPLALAIAAAAGLALFVVASPARAAALARRVPRPLRGRAERVADVVARGGLDRRTLVSTVALGIGAHLALSSVFACTGAALGVTVPVTTLLAVGNAIVLAVLLPVSVGGVGVREGVAVALLGASGVATADAFLVALLGYVTGQVPALVGGVLMATGGAPRAEPQRAPLGASALVAADRSAA